MANIRRAVALTLVVAVLLVACQPDGRVFQTTLPTDDRDPLPVTLTDETGLVTRVVPAQGDPATWNFAGPTLHADPNDPNASILTWTGGMCDQDTTVRFHEQHGGYLLNVAIHENSGFGCPAAAVLRAIRIATSSPLPIESVTVAGNG